MELSDPIKISYTGAKAFYKVIVYYDNGNKFGELDFSNLKTASKVKNYLTAAIRHYEEHRTRKGSG